MSVESYLESIRRNTVNTSEKTSKLESTFKDLLNYETLKRTVATGMDDSKSMKRLAELSQKILISQNATTEELKIANDLMLEFFAQFSGGKVSASSETWIKSLKEVLDEFGDNLPEKFQKRIQNDIAGIASDAGANGSEVLNQLQDTQKSQTEILQAIYSGMKEREKETSRKAEAEKPARLEEKRTTENFWKITMQGVKNLLSDISKGMGKGISTLGFLYAGMSIFGELKKPIQDIFRVVSILSAPAAFKPMQGIANLLKSINKKADETKKSTLIGKIRTSVRKAQVTTGRSAQVSSAFADAIIDVTKGTKFQGVGSFLGGAGKVISGIQGFVSKSFGFVRKIASVGGKIARIARPFSRLLGTWVAPVIAIFDFIQGFINTQGTVGEKVVGGLKNMVFQFFSSIGNLIAQIPKVAINMLKKTIDFFKGGWKNAISGVGSTVSHMLKSVFSIITIPMASTLDELANMIDSSKHPKIHGFLTTTSSMIRKFIPQDPSLASGLTSSGSSSSGASSIISMPTGAVLPYSASDVVATTPVSGVNKKSDVILSSQATDFYKRAGLTERITSGMEGKHAGTASNPRSHYSGNKFDLDVNTKDANAFANTVAKLLRTPGLLEIRTESIPHSTVEGGRKILEGMGLNTARLKNDGYPSYSSGPHLDILIDPSQSGESQTEIATSVNSFQGSLHTQLAKAYNEQVSLLNSIKAPDQLAANQLKTASDAITGQMQSKATGDSITFNKKTDISDANLAALQLFQLSN